MKPVKNSVNSPKGFSLFSGIRKSKEDEHKGFFFRTFSQTFLTLEAAADDSGIHIETLLELAYQGRIILIFPRPSNVEIHKGQATSNKFLSVQQDCGRDFLVMPSSGCYSLIFKQVTDVYEVEMAISFSHTRGFFVSILNEENSVSFSELLLKPGVSEILKTIESGIKTGELEGFKVSPEEEGASNVEALTSKDHTADCRSVRDVEVWNRWIFLDRGNRKTVEVRREDLYIHLEELDLALELLKDATREKVESFHSDKLQHLKVASRLHWGSPKVIENRDTTHPRVEVVEEWFRNNAKMSASEAKSAASFIRPSFAKLGRRKNPENQDLDPESC